MGCAADAYRNPQHTYSFSSSLHRALYYFFSIARQTANTAANESKSFLFCDRSLAWILRWIFRPGTGTFWAISYMTLMGFEITRATGSTKLMNFTSNIVSVAVFAFGGSILLLQGIVMAIGQTIGAQLGARFAVKKGIGIIRPLFILVALATIARLLYLRFF